jgi:hypothetical protein
LRFAHLASAQRVELRLHHAKRDALGDLPGEARGLGPNVRVARLGPVDSDVSARSAQDVQNAVVIHRLGARGTAGVQGQARRIKVSAEV